MTVVKKKKKIGLYILSLHGYKQFWSYKNNFTITNIIIYLVFTYA